MFNDTFLMLSFLGAKPDGTTGSPDKRRNKYRYWRPAPGLYVLATPYSACRTQPPKTLYSPLHPNP